MATRLPRLPDSAALLRLRTRQLLLVARLGQERHLGRAAAALGVSQPAATKLLQQMEAALDTRLFERHARGMQPTASGEVLIRYAQQMLADFGAAREEMGALDAGLRGSLRLGSVPGALPELVAPALAAYQRSHPRVAVSLVVATSDVMLAQLARDEVDLVLGRLTAGFHDDDYDAQPLLGEAQVVVVRAGHSLMARARSRRAPLDLERLAQLTWVLQPPGSPQRSRFEDLMRAAGLHQRLALIETGSTVATTTLLEQSDMAAVMPASLARHYARLGVLAVLPFELPMQVPAIHLIRRRARRLAPAAEAFVAGVQALARSAPAAGRVSSRPSPPTATS
jgi:DNA-binding transcriptional LysR family regulator